MNHSEKYYSYLKDRIEYYCTIDGCYPIFWDYSDSLSSEDLRDICDSYAKKGYASPYDYLETTILEQNFDYEDYFLNNVLSDVIQTKDQDLFEELKNTEDEELLNDLIKIGYRGIDANIKDLLKNTAVRINVIFATPEEINSNMSNISSSLGDNFHSPDFDSIATFNNALTYLIHQQGHTIEEYLISREKNPFGFSKSDLPFIDSVTNEIVNMPSFNQSALTALIRLEGKDILTFFEKLHDGKEYLEFSKDTEIGLFNPFNGSGSILEINLEKPFIVPSSMVFKFQIEGEKTKNQFGYSVDQVYGLVSCMWKNTLSYTTEPPKLVQENLSKFSEKSSEIMDTKDYFDIER